MVAMSIRVAAFGCLLVLSPLFADEKIFIDRQTATILYDPTFEAEEKKHARNWIKFVLHSATQVFGELPQDSINVKLEKHGGNYGITKRDVDNNSSLKSQFRRAGPVPWGEVRRTNPVTIKLIVNPLAYSWNDIRRDWTAYHEVSHLFIPYDGWSGPRWFIEGLASYYQNILQGRSGLVSEKRMWNKLVAGFVRGEKDDQLGRYNLNVLSKNVRNFRAFMRVYWSGAFYWFKADVIVRRDSNNQQSLDSLLGELKSCCQHRELNGRNTAKKLDELYGKALFLPLFNSFQQLHAMPTFRPLLRSLGIIESWGDVTLQNDAPLLEIRKSIYQKRS